MVTGRKVLYFIFFIVLLSIFVQCDFIQKPVMQNQMIRCYRYEHNHKYSMKVIVISLLLVAAYTQAISINNCAIADLVNSLCLVCRPNFQLDSGKCNQCIPTYVLSNGSCVLKTVTSSSTLSATSTNGAQLASITSDATLMAALQAYFQQLTTGSGSPLQSNPCTAASNGVCISCSQNFTLLNGVCVSSAPTITTFISSNSSSTAGLTTSTATQAQASAQQTSGSTSSSSSVSTGSAPAIVAPSTSTTSTASSSTQNVVCLPFYTSQTVPGTVSITATTSQTTSDNNDQNCKNYSSTLGVCSQCYQGYYYSSLNQSCIATNPLCLNVTLNNLCLSCYTGYTLVNGNCIIDSTNIINDDFCKTKIPNTIICITCYTGYYLNQSANRCYKANANCKTTTSLNTCSSCYQGYQLVNNDCVPTVQIPLAQLPPDAQSLDQFCSKFVNSTCITCSNRYYLASNGRCMQVDPYCKTYTDKGVCLLCYVGYRVLNGGCAILNLDSPYSTPSEGGIQCPRRTVLIGSTCVKVNDLCNTWSDVTALCTSCYKGYALTAGGACNRF